MPRRLIDHWNGGSQRGYGPTLCSLFCPEFGNTAWRIAGSVTRILYLVRSGSRSLAKSTSIAGNPSMVALQSIVNVRSSLISTTASISRSVRGILTENFSFFEGEVVVLVLATPRSGVSPLFGSTARSCPMYAQGRTLSNWKILELKRDQFTCLRKE